MLHRYINLSEISMFFLNNLKTHICFFKNISYIYIYFHFCFVQLRIYFIKPWWIFFDMFVLINFTRIFIRTFCYKGYLLNIFDQLNLSRTILDSSFFEKDFTRLKKTHKISINIHFAKNSIVCIIFSLKHVYKMLV